MNNTWSIQTRYLVLVILMLLLAALVYFARALIGPLVVAALIAYVLDPAVSLIGSRFRVHRRFAVPIVYSLFLLNLIAIPAVLTPIVIDQVETMRLELNNFQARYEEVIIDGTVFGVPFVQDRISIDIQNLLLPILQPQQVFGVLQVATENLAWILVIFVTTYYFLLDSARMRNWFIRLVPHTYQSDAMILYRQVKDVWQAYLRGQLLVMVIIGTLTWFTGMVVGLPDALLIGILAGALDVIPSIGPVVAMVVAAIVAFLGGSTYLPLSNFWFMVLVLGLFAGIQFFENVWLRPRILGHRLHLHPAVVFVAIVGALVLAGVVVALVIVPIIRSCEILGRYILRRILGLDPWSDTSAGSFEEIN